MWTEAETMRGEAGRSDATAALAGATFLGPTRVCGVEGPRVRVALPDREIWALLAVAALYRPQTGDQVLTIGHAGQYYVIGVLESSASTCLTFPGDVRLLAPNGRIHLTSGEGIHLDAPEVGVTTGRFELAAREAFQRLTNLYQWVGDLLQVRAGRSRTVVEGTAHAEAERTLIRSVKETTIDGEQIRLG